MVNYESVMVKARQKELSFRLGRRCSTRRRRRRSGVTGEKPVSLEFHGEREKSNKVCLWHSSVDIS